MDKLHLHAAAAAAATAGDAWGMDTSFDRQHASVETQTADEKAERDTAI